MKVVRTEEGNYRQIEISDQCGDQYSLNLGVGPITITYISGPKVQTVTIPRDVFGDMVAYYRVYTP